MEMVMAKQYRNPEKTRADLLGAAGDLLVEKGLRGFSVHEVAKRAGFGKPLVYRYFGARGAVLDALAQAKADEIRQRLKETNVPEGVSVSQNVFQQITYARILAADKVLQWLYRAALTGELGVVAAKGLDDLIPKSGASGDNGAAEAFLLGGISYVLLLRDSQGTCAGVPIETANDMAAFERAFVALCSKI
jgi:AcrR family transcriptional regulator